MGKRARTTTFSRLLGLVPIGVCALSACGGGTEVLLGGVPASVATNPADASASDALASDGSRDAANDVGIEANDIEAEASEAEASEAEASEANASLCGDAGAAAALSATLLTQVVGFGRAATGGGPDGCVYHVTSLADAGAGTLRDAAGLLDPLWIVFDVSGDLSLLSDVAVSSNKTIDGRGAHVTIHDYGLVVTGPAANVIVENISFTSALTTADNDAIRLINGAHTIWIDHSTFSGYADGHIDVTHAATDLTVSWCSFSNHDKAILLGGNVMDTGDTDIRATLHHNFWNQIGNYTPRLRFGQVHMFNNVAEQWKSAAAIVTMNGQIYSESNVYVEATHPVAIFTEYADDPTPGNAVSVSDLLQNGATVEMTDAGTVFTPAALYAYKADPADVSLVNAVTANSGAR